MARGGAETAIMNYYRYIDRGKVQFDFLTMVPGEHNYDAEIRKLGGNVFCINSPQRGHPIRHIKDLVSVMSHKGPFAAVHAHTLHHAGLVMLAARIAGIKKKICHSHNTSDVGANLIWRKTYFSIMKKLIKMYADQLLACGEDAGRYLFGKNVLKSGKVIILRNAIDMGPYKSLELTKRDMFRHKLGISQNTLVLGYVARFSYQKNHIFFVKLLKVIKSVREDVRLILVGDGELRSYIERRFAENGLSRDVMFLGVRSDIAQLMSTFDVFILPSLYEGLPVVLIEAQAAGTPCVVSSSVTKEADIGLGLIKFVDLSSDIMLWCEIILEQSCLRRPSNEIILTTFRERGYDAEVAADKLLAIYC